MAATTLRPISSRASFTELQPDSGEPQVGRNGSKERGRRCDPDLRSRSWSRPRERSATLLRYERHEEQLERETSSAWARSATRTFEPSPLAARRLLASSSLPNWRIRHVAAWGRRMTLARSKASWAAVTAFRFCSRSLVVEMRGGASCHQAPLQRPLGPSPRRTSTPRDKEKGSPTVKDDVLSAPGRIRTCGLSLRRRTLYPLSYEGGDPPLY
jgi:hypothetical protein